MEKKSKVVVLCALVSVILVVSVISVVKVYKEHKKNLYLVVEKEITESARRCFLEELCEGESITLGELINKGYLDRPIDPKTKEYISEDLIITFDGEKCYTKIK